MSELLKKVDIFTDGACSGNPGPGGYGVILRYNGIEKVLSGGEPSTTNNRMELLGVISGLEAPKTRCCVKLYTDSKYVVEAVVNGWAKSWKAKGWKRKDGKPAKNPELWERLLQLLDKHEVEFIWIKGHDGHPENERCDALAVAERSKFD